MTTEPLFFKPVFKERIWGGTALADFGYTIPSQRTGSAGLLPRIKMVKALFKTECIRGSRSANYGNIIDIYSDSLKGTVSLCLQKY